MSLRKAVACVRNHKNFLITSHMNLEGDALGSELAFMLLLKKLGKGAVVVNEDGIPYGYDFLPQLNTIRRFGNKIKGIKFDCFTVLDCSDLERPGKVRRINTDNKPVLNIDHHISNKRFGEVNWVEPMASSCAEMIYKLYKKMRVSLDKEAALLLYVGMLTDTGSFRYPNTTSFTHKAVSELLRFGLNPQEIYKNIYGNIPLEDMRLLTKILPNLKCTHGGKIAWIQVKRNILANRKLSFDLSEHILSFARAIKGVEAVALFKENLGVKNEIRVNLRSQGKVDVNKIAQSFGGGGHKTASGATVQGSLELVRKKVLAKIRESLR